MMGKKTLLLLIENLDDLFNGLGKEGQNKFHSFLQENNCAVLATSTTRFEAINQETSAFYNFFDIKNLEDFSTEEATQLLVNIAKLEGKSDLELYIRTTGKSRIQAVHHLAGGNPRFAAYLTEFNSFWEKEDYTGALGYARKLVENRAIKKLDDGKQADLEDTELILRILFTNTAQTHIWKNHIQSLIQLFQQYKSLSPLSQGIVRNIPTLMSETVSNKAVQTWLQIWQELAANYPEFEVALRLLNTGVRYPGK